MINGWLKALRDEIEVAEGQEFEWGRQDCCLFAARCVDAMTGSSLAGQLQSEYTDKTSALRYLAKQGGIAPAVTQLLGQPIRWVNTHRGDVCLMPTADGIGSLGICIGGAVACVSEIRGIVYLPIGSALYCWSIR